MRDYLNIGVFCCNCGGLIDTAPIRAALGDRGDVHYRESSRLCGTEQVRDMVREINDAEIDRLVIGACLDEGRRLGWIKALAGAGLDPYLSVTTSIQGEDPADSVLRAMARAAALEPLETSSHPVTRRALVLGGGLTALRTALELAGMGHEVVMASEGKAGARHVVPELAHGNTGGWEGSLDDRKVDPARMLRLAEASDRVSILEGARLMNVDGQVGAFRTRFTFPGDDDTEGVEVEAGAIIVASDYATRPRDLCDDERGIISQSDFWNNLSDLPRRRSRRQPAPTVVFWVHPDDETSALPFIEATQAAIAARQRLKAEAYVVCGDARVAGPGLEELYQSARRRGVVFIKENDRSPDLEILTSPEGDNQSVVISGSWDGPADVSPGRPTEDGQGGVPYDILVLSESIEPGDEGTRAAGVLQLDLGPGGFLVENNVYFEPSATNRRGIFAAGGCRGPKTLTELLSDADNAALGAAGIISRGEIIADENTAYVDAEKCALCLTCLRSCPHGAVAIAGDMRSTEVFREACQSCGICASECPGDAIQLQYYTDDQVLAELGSPEDARGVRQ